MKKKVGILTLSSSDNCGSLLQTYALMKTIKKLKCDVEIINFNPVESRNIYNIFPRNIFRHPKRTLFSVLNYNKLKKQKKDYSIFREKNLNLTAEIKKEKDLEHINSNYTTVICGSDQIWNVKMADFNYAYFLDWCKGPKKISYAASLGKTNFDKFYNVDKIKESLNSFDAISVREDHAKIEVEKLSGKNAIVLADPTLLLTESEWSELINDRFVKDEYIFYYSWAYNNDKLNNIVSEYSKKKNIKVVVINPSKWNKKKPEEYGFTLFESSGPIAFLNLMKHSKKAFVQSFHGVIFANQFKKDFYFLDEHEDDSLDARLESILNLFNQKDRVVRKYSDIKEASINYEYNVKYEELKNKSIEFLKNNIK